MGKEYHRIWLLYNTAILLLVIVITYTSEGFNVKHKSFFYNKKLPDPHIMDQEAELFSAVAEVLAYVYKKKNR